MPKNIKIGDDFFENVKGKVIIVSDEDILIEKDEEDPEKEVKKRKKKHTKDKRNITVGRDYISISSDTPTTVITGDTHYHKK